MTRSTRIDSGVVRLEGSQVEAAADVLARAFFDDPFAAYLLPDRDGREDLLFWYFGAVIEYGLLVGDVYAIEQGRGVMIWLRENYEQLGGEHVQQAAIFDAPEVLGSDAFERLMLVTGDLRRRRRAELPTPHWYLPTLGVDPSSQDRGIGGALLSWACARADGDDLRCYLETFNERTADFYRRHGFVCSAAAVVPGTQLRYWTFRREPVSRALTSA